MSLRRTLVLLAASMAALTVGGEAMAAPAAPPGPELGDRRGAEFELPVRAARAAATDSLYTARSPVRVLDTRTSGGPVPGRGVISLDLSDRVPVGTTAVVLNLTGVAPTLSSFVTVWPAEESRPTASNLNLAANEIRSNAVTVMLGASRTLRLYNNSGNIHLVADLSGHYAPEAEGFYNTRAPQRVLDTRISGRPVPAGGTINVDTGSLLPFSGAKAVTANLTVVSPTASTFLTAFPAGSTRPTASSINVARGTVTANQVTVALGSGRDIQIYNHSGSAHVIVDVVGHYDTDFGDVFLPLSPERAFDSRTDGGALDGGFYYQIWFTQDPADPTAQISSMVLNVTGTGGTAPTFLTVYPSGESRPNASTVNLTTRQTAANAATSGLGWESDGFGTYYGFNVYNHSGSIHVVVDLAGIFVPPLA